jgi:flagellar hook-associated protein FlgK
MSLHSMISAGLRGIQAGQSKVDVASGKIAQFQAYQDSTEVADAMIAMREGEYQAKFGAEVVQAADEMLGTLIDIKA